jgi:hypothetical protein
VIGDGSVRLGVLTDAGHVTPHMVSMLNGCDAIVLECNHDAMLTASDFRTDLAAASWERGDPVVNLVFECQA